MKRLRTIYLIIVVALLAGYFTAGASGFRVLSAFSSIAYVHTMTAGVHHK